MTSYCLTKRVVSIERHLYLGKEIPITSCYDKNKRMGE